MSTENSRNETRPSGPMNIVGPDGRSRTDGDLAELSRLLQSEYGPLTEAERDVADRDFHTWGF
ncbi:hypothetical protein ACN20G_10335 [Streptomyces sp. BI20]|uniref:hypothetical protein n=1 Tax=Streptomyces sp. BI20 TaxID=3403460 RepID=UPI003C75066E